MYRIVITLFFVATTLASTAQVQLTEERFGKTRIQNKNFEWKLLASDNFEVHYYEGGEKPARLAIDYLEGEFPRIMELLGYPPYSKTRILIYNSVKDLQQSNVGINSEEMNHMGELVNRQSYVEVAFTGQFQSFKEELTLQVARNFVFEILFAGNSTDFFESAYQLSLPEWFQEGMARYVAKGWDDHMDDYVRQFALKNDFRKLNRYSGEEAAILGQSVWNYIAVRYGTRNISNILNLTRIIRNEENSIGNSIGIRFSQFSREWFNFYQTSAQNVNENYLTPSAVAMARLSAGQQSSGMIKISPDGQYAAYNAYKEGTYQLVLWDLNSDAKRVIYSGGRKVFDQEVVKTMPVFDWQSNELLFVADEQNKGFKLFSINLSGQIQESVDLPQFTHVHDFNVAPDGRRIVVSATVNGQNDLFLYLPGSNFLRRLTNDLFDVYHPNFLVGRNAVVFSSNRSNDTLQVRINRLSEVSDHFNLYVFDLDTTENVLGRLTATISNDFQPVAQGPDKLLFSSDQRGIRNLYAYDFNTRSVAQVTANNVGFTAFDYSGRGNELVYLALQDGQIQPARLNTDLNNTFFPNLTIRQQTKQALMVAERRAAGMDNVRDQLNPNLTDNLSEATKLLLSRAREGEVLVDTENYTFDIEQEELPTPTRRTGEGTILSSIRDRSGASSRILGPFDFDGYFAIDHVQVDTRIDPLRGFGIMPRVRLSDVLENHTFTGAAFFSLDFNRGGEFFARYEYRKNKADFSAQYYRRSFNQNTSDVQHKYLMDQVEILASYPINSFAQFRIGPVLTQTRFFDQDSRLLTPNLPPGLPPTESTNQYLGGKAELVFDNSSVITANISKGTKAKANVSWFDHTGNAAQSFGKIRLDARHYQPISRNVIFAARLNYGRFFGESPKRFLVGGTENWLFNRVRDSDGNGSSDPLDFVPLRDQSDILFHEFVPTVRGFDFNFFNGTDFLSFNAELRFPIFSYLHRGPIASTFLRNFQLIGFYDVGSSWSNGKSPFTEQSSQNIEIIQDPGSPFSAVINNFGNPWLQSMGAGIRTVVMGYFVRLDLAYPIEAYRTPSSRFLVSLGYDF